MIVDSLSGVYFTNKLEKHITDYRAGKAELSREVGSQLERKREVTSTDFAYNDPKALSLYSGFLTILRYDRKARFINGVSETQNFDGVLKSLKSIKA